MMETIRHVMRHMWVRDAFRSKPSMTLKPYWLLQVPPIMMAMAYDWDLTCVHPFLKRLCHELRNEVVCGKGSGREDDVDLVLSLTSSTWTKGNTLEPIPICPVVIQNGTHQEATDRLKKWLVDYFACLEQNKFAYPDHEWPVRYFVLEGFCWTAGVAFKRDNGLQLFEQPLGSIGWFGGVQKVTLVLGQIIGSTAEHYREWYREHRPN